MNIGLLCGSRSERSANAAILLGASETLREAGHTCSAIVGMDAVPAFDPAAVDDAPALVVAFRDQLRKCDALLIAAPEYAAGVAGWTKNALDWLVGDSTIYRKVIGVASAGTTGGEHAIDQLVRTISWQGGWVMATLAVAMPRTKSDPSGIITDEATLADIQKWATTVAAARAGSPAQRRELLVATVSRFNIDPARFGDID